MEMNNIKNVINKFINENCLFETSQIHVYFLLDFSQYSHLNTWLSNLETPLISLVRDIMALKLVSIQ
jgi:hypothetical protein